MFPQFWRTCKTVFRRVTSDNRTSNHNSISSLVFLPRLLKNPVDNSLICNASPPTVSIPSTECKVSFLHYNHPCSPSKYPQVKQLISQIPTLSSTESPRARATHPSLPSFLPPEAEVMSQMHHDDLQTGTRRHLISHLSSSILKYSVAIAHPP